MWTIDRVIVLLWLIILAIEDYKTRTIEIKYLWGMFVITSVYMGVTIDSIELLCEHLGGFILGLCFLLASKCTKEKIGYGDSVVLCILGGYLGIYQFVSIVLLSFLLCSVYGSVNIAIKNIHRSTEIPYLPFLLAGYVGGLI